MATLIENINAVKSAFSDIKAAIEEKGVTVADKTPVTEYASLIAGITGGSQAPEAKAIFNHSGVIGLNSDFSDYVLNYSSGAIQVTDFCIQSPNKDCTNTMIAFTNTPIYKENYTKLCFDCEVSDGYNGTWNGNNLGIRYCSRGTDIDRYNPNLDKQIVLTDYTTQKNYNGTEPWYICARQTVEIDLTDINDYDSFYLVMRACSCVLKVYSIWME